TATFWSVSDLSAFEGQPSSGPTTNFTFTIRFTGQTPSFPVNVTVSVSSPGGANGAQLGVDTVAFPATTIAVNAAATPVTIQVRTDLASRGNRVFNVNLSGLTGTLVRNGVGTIIDDDANTMNIGNVVQYEGNSGVTSFNFPVVLSNASLL